MSEDDPAVESDGAKEDADLAGYGQAVDLAVQVPTLSGAIAAGVVAGVVWTARQLRHRRATGALHPGTG